MACPALCSPSMHCCASAIHSVRARILSGAISTQVTRLPSCGIGWSCGKELGVATAPLSGLFRRNTDFNHGSRVLLGLVDGAELELISELSGVSGGGERDATAGSSRDGNAIGSDLLNQL